MIRVRLLRKWGPFGAGSVIDMGQGKAGPLIATGAAEKVSNKEKINEIRTGNRLLKVRLKLLKPWGPYGIDSIIDVGETKARPLIDDGTAVVVTKKDKLIKKPLSKKAGAAENAMATPLGETTEVGPKADADAKVKAKDKADAKAKKGG